MPKPEDEGEIKVFGNTAKAAVAITGACWVVGCAPNS